ncbi:ACOT9 thioesterase, partial [Polyodon spathula]|nr:ACOT9 thioesterase [Polyodon spathula]
MLRLRFQVLRSLPSMLCRSISSGPGSSPAGGQAPDMAEVRDRLREIVGVSTNWSDHRQAMKDRTSLSSLLAKRQEDLPPRRMKDSYIEVHLPLGSQHGLREKYLNVHNSVR